MATNIFISYATEDAEYLAELETHLALLKRDGIIRTWHLGCVAPGVQWEDQRRTEIDSAQIVVVLLSADFLASESCCDTELQHAAQRAFLGQARLIPVLLRACVWRTTLFEYARVLPGPKHPLTASSNRDDAWAEVVSAILDAVHEFDQSAALMAYRHQTFVRAPSASSTFSFVRVCLDRADDNWDESTRSLPTYQSPFSAEPGQYIFLRRLVHAENGALSLSLDVTVMNHSTAPLVLTKVGIQVLAVAQICYFYGRSVPTKVRKTDSYVLEMPDVCAILNSKFPGASSFDSQGPVSLELLVSAFVDDPILLPPMTPYRYGLRLAGYSHRMPNHALIRAWALTSGGEATSACLDIFTK